MSGKGDIPNPEAWLQGPLLSGAVDPVLSQIALSWIAPTPTYKQFLGYSVFRQTKGSGGFALIASGIQTTSYIDAALTPTFSYTYFVAPVWSDGEKAPSNQLTFFGLITDVFSASGTWAKRVGMKSAIVTAIGSGAGGPSGNGTDGNTQLGVGGGGAGGLAQGTYAVANLPATAVVTVGAPGTGAPAVNFTNGGAGIPQTAVLGTNGATSSFAALVVATGGTIGNGSSSSFAAGGTGSVTGVATNVLTEAGGTGGQVRTGAGADTTGTAPNTTFAPSGGGGGMGSSGFGASTLSAFICAGGNVANGSAGGAGGAGLRATNADPILNYFVIASAASAGIPAANPWVGGSGGGGGGFAISFIDTPRVGSAVGGAGGAGAFPGGGGGGGGGADYHPWGEGQTGAGALTCAAGGNGGSGVVVVRNFFW